MLVIAVCILSILSILSISYIEFLQLQLRGINKQLTKRLKEHTRKPLTLALFNKELNTLASNINKCLKEEENLRIDAMREEKHFKEMISDISHDLRTPLTAIKGYQQLIGKETLTDDARNKLRIAQKHADELGALIEHFFEYTYLINAEPKFKIEKLNLMNITVECIAEAVEILEESNLKVNFYDAIPVFAMGDREAVIRIIQNLIRNCAQHADSDIDVHVFAEQSAVISFRNFVKESSEIDINRLFDRFYIADKARRSRTTGLGLSIVKLLSEYMGGSTGASLKDGILDIQVRIPLF